MLAAETRINRDQPREAAKHQTGADRKHQRQRDFSHHKAAAQRLMPADSAAHRPLLQRTLQIHMGEAQRGNKPEEGNSEQGNKEHKKQNAAVNRDRLAARQRRVLGNEREQSAQSDVREDQTRRHSRQCQHQALDQQLLNDARSCRS